jgi:hypothetical protein
MFKSPMLAAVAAHATAAGGGKHPIEKLQPSCAARQNDKAAEA